MLYLDPIRPALQAAGALAIQPERVGPLQELQIALHRHVPKGAPEIAGHWVWCLSLSLFVDEVLTELDESGFHTADVEEAWKVRRDFLRYLGGRLNAMVEMRQLPQLEDALFEMQLQFLRLIVRLNEILSLERSRGPG